MIYVRFIALEIDHDDQTYKCNLVKITNINLQYDVVKFNDKFYDNNKAGKKLISINL